MSEEKRVPISVTCSRHGDGVLVQFWHDSHTCFGSMVVSERVSEALACAVRKSQAADALADSVRKSLSELCGEIPHHQKLCRYCDLHDTLAAYRAAQKGE